MVLSSGNRKSFALNLHIPLSRSSSASPSSSKDSALSQSDRSLHSYPLSPSRAAFLSPRGPIPPVSLHVKQEQPIIPIPLTDGLDPSEKMKLLRKTRKLSRILGEVPIPVSVDSPVHTTMDFRFLSVLEEPASATSAASNPPVDVDSQNSLKRSATVSHNRHAQQKEIHRARSLASLRPSLSIPPAAITIHPSPISPITFAWPDNYPIPPSPISPVSTTDERAPEETHSRRDSTVSSRRDSVASSIFPSQRTPEQVLRARAAKLARQLGDNIPPDVLLRASSPQPRSPLTSSSVMSFAETSMTIREAPPRTSSTARRTKVDRRDVKRRLSLDLRAFVRIPEPPVPSPALSDTDKYRGMPSPEEHRSAGREGSAPHTSTTRPYDTEPEEDTPDVAPPAVERDSDLEADSDSDWDEADGPRPLSRERQRALNVRRARKMLQVFGNEPPPALFQITNIPADATGEGISVALSIAHRRDDSRATTASAPSSTLSVPETQQHGQRDSVGTTSSGDNLSPLVFADPASVPPSRPHSPHHRPVDGEGDPIPPLPPLPPSQDTVLEVGPSSPLSVPTVASSSLHSLACPSTISIPASHTHSVLDNGPLSSPIRPSFQASPPANQTMFLWGPASAPTSPPLAAATVLSDPPAEVHPADPHFRDRRRRAAKLSRFFGVGLNDIAGMLRGGSSSSSAGAPAISPTPPPLREFKRSGSSDSIPSPLSPRENLPSPTSVRSSRSTRPATSSGIIGTPSVSISESPRSRKRTLSSGARSQSVSGKPRRPQTQGSMQSAGERNRSNSQPEVMSQQVHNRAFSTTVEVLAESKGRFAFLDARRPSKVKELNMHDVVRELRKIK
ncbi:hypothetical protein OH77DRAFT_1444543 [Trametes cingulata]|nr:hypothetical protein OH77DRAFT_1444543 [Trametes cingulata]